MRAASAACTSSSNGSRNPRADRQRRRAGDRDGGVSSPPITAARGTAGHVEVATMRPDGRLRKIVSAGPGMVTYRGERTLRASSRSAWKELTWQQVLRGAQRVKMVKQWCAAPYGFPEQPVPSWSHHAGATVAPRVPRTVVEAPPCPSCSPRRRPSSTSPSRRWWFADASSSIFDLLRRPPHQHEDDLRDA